MEVFPMRTDSNAQIYGLMLALAGCGGSPGPVDAGDWSAGFVGRYAGTYQVTDRANATGAVTTSSGTELDEVEPGAADGTLRVARRLDGGTPCVLSASRVDPDLAFFDAARRRRAAALAGVAVVFTLENGTLRRTPTGLALALTWVWRADTGATGTQTLQAMVTP
jgi:hypothetical protein